jgi:hypothetical protein
MGDGNMSAAAELAAAYAAGITLKVSSSKLRLECVSEPSAELIERIKRNKSGIIALLRDAEPEQNRDEWLRPAPPGGWPAMDWRVFFDERAVVEFDGELPRLHAET